MTKPIRLFVMAGEASGDRLGADLVQRLRSKAQIEVIGVGGPELEAEGLTSLFPITDIAVMGWSDVLRRLPLLLWRLHQTVRAIIASRPDVVVLIDSQVFSTLVAKRIRKAGLTVPTLLYVAPTVWAWKPERAPALRGLFDEVLAVLPFEPAAMARLGGPPTSYVGHPALQRHPMRQDQPASGQLLLLPGSRAGELRRHLELVRAVAERMADHPSVSGFTIPTLPYLADRLRAETAQWQVPIEIVTGDARTVAFQQAVAAFAVSGTITLELAMSGVPMLVTYVGDQRQAVEFAKIGTPRIALPNIVAGRQIVGEALFAEEPEPEIAVGALKDLLETPDAIAAQLRGFREIRALMEKGAPEAPLQDPAERVLGLLDQRLLIGS
ncbi:lipid-A-disaccharide synthase [Devosia sp.]|uniref:lipid-A-disaccharide synthase n=1 Tax=Devosia sp. TaxID=1871048 RepID=UPI003BAD17DE